MIFIILSLFNFCLNLIALFSYSAFSVASVLLELTDSFILFCDFAYT